MSKMRATLDAEFRLDPVGFGYSGMNPAQATVALNAKTRQRRRREISTAELLDSIDVSEFDLLVPDGRLTVWNLLHIGGGSLLTSATGTAWRLIIGAFGVDSKTVVNLQSVVVESISRAEELQLGTVTEADVVAA